MVGERRPRRTVKRALIAVLALLGVGLVFCGRELAGAVRFLDGIEVQASLAEARGPRAFALAQNCAPCHGFDGNNLSSRYPSLAGLPASYIETQLRAFADGQRDEPMMGPLAMSLSDEEMALLASFYAQSQVRANPFLVIDPTRRDATESLTASCSACHGSALQGDANRMPETPRLRGQGEAYLARQLQDYRSGRRADPSGAMNALAQSMTDEDIARIAYALQHR
ncbi:MAG: c-type cytochrome [Myxococcota bacterium]